SPLMGAHVTLTDPSNSSTVSTVVDKDGGFLFSSLRIGRTYKVTVSYVGYEPQSVDIRIDRPEKKLGDMLLKPKAEWLKEVEVVGLAERVEQKGDTTIYNADAYKTA